MSTLGLFLRLGSSGRGWDMLGRVGRDSTGVACPWEMHYIITPTTRLFPMTTKHHQQVILQEIRVFGRLSKTWLGKDPVQRSGKRGKKTLQRFSQARDGYIEICYKFFYL
jgi:hypothetical protein